MLSDTESTADREGLKAQFQAAVAPLADGELTFQPPFDLASAAALADNIDSGRIAEMLFAVTALRDCGFTVHITAHSPAHPELPDRELINTTVPSSRLLIALLDGLLNELDAHQHDTQ